MVDEGIKFWYIFSFSWEVSPCKLLLWWFLSLRVEWRTETIVLCLNFLIHKGLR